MSDRILLVEDDPELGRQVKGQLEGAGFAVDWLTNGDEAMLVSYERDGGFAVAWSNASCNACASSRCCRYRYGKPASTLMRPSR